MPILLHISALFVKGFRNHVQLRIFKLKCAFGSQNKHGIFPLPACAVEGNSAVGRRLGFMRLGGVATAASRRYAAGWALKAARHF